MARLQKKEYIDAYINLMLEEKAWIRSPRLFQLIKRLHLIGDTKYYHHSKK
jgi:hypothetical protein